MLSAITGTLSAIDRNHCPQSIGNPVRNRRNPHTARKARIFALAHRIQSLAQMPHDMELIEQNRRLRCIRLRRQTERLPHVHDGKANARTLLLAEPGVELAHACLRAVLAAKPDRPPAHKVADHNPVGVTFADRYLVDADDLRTRRAHALELGFHVLHVQRLHGVPIQRQFLRNVLDCRPATPPADKVSKALGVERIVREKVEPFPLHLATTAARDPPHLQFQKYPRVTARKIAYTADLAVVPPHLNATATATSRFFERRLSVMTRAFGSPKIPRTVCSGRKPGNQYVSQSRRLRFAARAIHHGCQIPCPAVMQNTQAMHSFLNHRAPKIAHSIPRRPNFLNQPFILMTSFALSPQVKSHVSAEGFIHKPSEKGHP